MPRIIQSALIKKNNNGYLWNSIAGLVNAGEAVVLSAVITRTSGLNDAGIMSIAFAIGNLMMTIGKFGVRNYQVTDDKNEFSFSQYAFARVISVLIMLLAFTVYLFVNFRNGNYSLKKTFVIFSVCIIYTIESVEDLYWGLFQKKNALDVGAKIFIIRWVAAILLMTAILVTKKDLMTACLAGMIISALLEVIMLLSAYPYFKEIAPNINPQRGLKILYRCIPLFLVSFLSFYIINLPKYAIDKYLSEEIQACYGFVSMPVFVIGLLSSFVYQPILIKLSSEWNCGEYIKFKKIVFSQIGIIAVITVICLAGAFILGVPVLSALYATDLTNYKAELLILLTGGGMFAAASFLSVIITAMRAQKWILIPIIAVSIAAYEASPFVVKNYRMRGAAILYLLEMIFYFACMLIIFFKAYYGRKENGEVY